MGIAIAPEQQMGGTPSREWMSNPMGAASDVRDSAGMSQEIDHRENKHGALAVSARADIVGEVPAPDHGLGAHEVRRSQRMPGPIGWARIS